MCGWGEGEPRGGTAAMGQHLLPWPWVPGGILPRAPGCLWVMLLGPAGCYRQPSAATSCPSRRWHVGSQGSLTELVGNPTTSRGDIATALGFHSALCGGSEEAGHLEWYVWVLSPVGAFSLSLPRNGLVSFCTFLFLAFSTPQIPWPTPAS